jgi:signal transduction histidine kinase
MTAYSLTRQFKDNEDVRLKLERLMSLIDRAIKSMRKIATQLRPRILDELGLVEAIRWETEDFQKSSGIPCRLELPAHAFPPQTIDNDISIALFRGLQEALNNVAKHSKAHNVWIAFGEQEKELFLSIQDDGIGISPERRNNIKSLGIIGMQERMLSIGGSLTLDSVAGKGTTVILHSPKERL